MQEIISILFISLMFFGLVLMHVIILSILDTMLFNDYFYKKLKGTKK
jgi:hypothetical protein